MIESGNGSCVYGYGRERDVIVAGLARYLKKLCWEKIPSELCDEFRSIVRSAAFHLMWWLDRHNFAPFVTLKYVALAYLWPHEGSTVFLEERFVVEHESQFPLIYYGIELGYDGQKTLLDFRSELLEAQTYYAVGTIFETGRCYKGAYRREEKEFAVKWGEFIYLGRRRGDGFDAYFSDVFTWYEPVVGQDILFTPYKEFDPEFPYRLFQVCPPKRDLTALLNK